MESPELFIGREKMRRFLLDEIFLPFEWKSKICPIVAPRGFGKTELIHAVVREFEAKRPAHIFHFYKDLEPGEDYIEFWTDLLERIVTTVDEEYLTPREGEVGTEENKQALLDVEYMRLFLRSPSSGSLPREEFCKMLGELRKKLFSAYTLLGICIVITVDDFERAGFMGPELYESLVALEAGAYPVRRANVSVILLSRRWVHSQKEEDEWESWIAPFYLGGFSNAELEEYFASYAELPCGLPDDETRLRILYLCGRSPELLMRTRDNLASAKELCKLDLIDIYDSDPRYFEYVCHNLTFTMRHLYSNEWMIDTLADLFVRQLLKPTSLSVTDAPEELELLRQNGFLSRESSRGNLYERLGMPIPPSVARTETDYIYEPITPFLLDFIRSQKADS